MISDSKQTEVSPHTAGSKDSKETAALSATRGEGEKTMTKKEALAALVAAGCVFFDQKDIRKDGDRA